MLIHAEHILQRQRLKVQPVTRVIVGRHRLRIAVHHDGLVPIFTQRKCRMAAAVIELNSLPDPVRPTPQNQNPLRHSSCTDRAYSSQTHPRTYPPSCRPALRSASSAAPAPPPYLPRRSIPSLPPASHPKSPSALPHATAPPSPQPSARRQPP